MLDQKLDKLKKSEVSVKFRRSLVKGSGSKGRKGSSSSFSPASLASYRKRPTYREEGRKHSDFRGEKEKRPAEHRFLHQRAAGNCFICEKPGHQAKSCPQKK